LPAAAGIGVRRRRAQPLGRGGLPYDLLVGVPLPAAAEGSQLDIGPLMPHHDADPLGPGVHDVRADGRLHRSTAAMSLAVATEHRPNSTSGQGASRARLTGSNPSDGSEIP